MDLKELNELEEKTLKHWKKDILGISAKELKGYNPVKFNTCPVCKHYDSNCYKCFLGKRLVYGYGCCEEVLEVCDLADDYQYNEICIAEYRAAARKAITAIKKRFAKKRKEITS